MPDQRREASCPAIHAGADALAEIDEAIIRAEMQIVLSQSALVIWVPAAGRTHEGLAHD